MSSQVSESEKRRLLRERRAKKFANGGATSRLSKITGQDRPLTTTSPLEAVAKDNEASTLEMDRLINERTKPAVQESAQEVAQVQLLKQLAAQEAPGVESRQDVFSLLNNLSADAAENGPLPEPVDPQRVLHHSYQINQLKAWFIFCKWFAILLPYLVLMTKYRQFAAMIPTQLQIIFKPSNFFVTFITFEVLAISVYFQRLSSIEGKTGIDTLQNNSSILKIISMVPDGMLPVKNLKKIVTQTIQYWDILSLLISDICYVLVVMGVLSYF